MAYLMEATSFPSSFFPGFLAHHECSREPGLSIEQWPGKANWRLSKKYWFSRNKLIFFSLWRGVTRQISLKMRVHLSSSTDQNTFDKACLRSVHLRHAAIQSKFWCNWSCYATLSCSRSQRSKPDAPDMEVIKFQLRRENRKKRRAENPFSTDAFNSS